MRGKRAWVWKVGRIVLAVFLLVIVFKYMIRTTDTVVLADGTEVTGTIKALTDAAVTVEVDGKETTFALKDVARRKGEPRVERGLVSLLRVMTPNEYLIGMLLLAVAPIVASVRWKMLLAAQEIHITLWKSMDLTLVGLFFNNFMPGLTGGDVVKAYYAAKLTEDRKTHAVVTVFLDRVIGIVALGLVAGAAILVGLWTAKSESGAEFHEAAWFVAVFVAACAVGGICFFSRRLRRFLFAVTKALPGYERVRRVALVHRAVDLVKKVDGAIFLYRYEKMVLVNTTLISFVAHGSAILAIYYFGHSLGITQATMLHYFIVVPVCFIISSVPVTPAGWGVGEAVFRVLFGAVGVPGTAAVTMSVIYRIGQAIWTLPGGVMFMFMRDRASVKEVEEEEGKIEASLAEGKDGVEGD